LAGQIGETIGNAIPLLVEFPPEYANMGGYQKDAARAMAVRRAEQVVERTKAAEDYGLLGLLLGVSLGLVGGLAAGSPRSGLFGSVIGGVIGAASGAVMSWVIVPWFFRNDDPEFGGMLPLFITHAGIFTGVGAAAGLALGLGVNEREALGRALLGGILGSLVATFVFETSNSLIFPLLPTHQPVPGEQLPRFMAHLCVAICTTLAAGLAVGTRPRSNAMAEIDASQKGPRDR
jgi:hypothetical protein